MTRHMVGQEPQNIGYVALVHHFRSWAFLPDAAFHRHLHQLGQLPDQVVGIGVGMSGVELE